MVVIYSTTTCPYCKMLKTYLDEHKIIYQEKLVDDDEIARQEMMSNSDGFLGVPFTVVTREDGTKETIIGFDKTRLNNVLGITNE